MAKKPSVPAALGKDWQAGLDAFDEFYARDKDTMLDDDERDDGALYDLLRDVFMTGWTMRIMHTKKGG